MLRAHRTPQQTIEDRYSEPVFPRTADHSPQVPEEGQVSVISA